MSRIGKKPIEIPKGVAITLQDAQVVVNGPLGSLSYTIPTGVSVDVGQTTLAVQRSSDQKRHKALHGLVRSLINNMVIGVTAGYMKSLQVEGIGYRVAKEGNVLNFSVGYSHPVAFPIPQGITITIEGQNKIVVRGIDKQLVGQVAADIRKIKKPEPYKGKGIRFTDEVVRRKEGKTGA